MNDRSGATDAGPATRGRDAGAHAGTPPTCPDPVFVIGSPRSGTTALAHSLARHSLLWASGESDVLYFLLANGFAERSFDRAMELPGRRWLRRERVSREEFLAYLGIGLNALMTSRSEGRRWIDHTPRYTRIVDTLAEVFPGASFIHILRDGREVVHSMLNFAAAASDPAVRRYLRRSVPWATEVRAACEEWRDHVEIAVSFGEHSDRACVVRYEDLVAAPGDAFAAVHGFLGIADEEGPAASFASRRINSSFKQRARPSGHEAWEGWAEEQRHVFAELAGPTMRRAGYWPADEERTVADTDRRTDGSGHGRRRGLMQAPEYARLVARVREIVESDTPPDSEVLVATRGDDGFLDLDGRRGWHFPRERDGGYAGRYPADSAAAIAHLEELRAQGATHLALPGSAFWWLDYYEGLREHLDATYPVIRRDENVIAYDLRAGRAAPPEGSRRSAVGGRRPAAHGEPAS